MTELPKRWPARYLLIGEAPSKNHGKRNLDVCLVCRALNIPPVAGTLGRLRTQHKKLFNFVMTTKHINLLDEWPGSSGRGSAFPIEKARETAHIYALQFGQYDAVFLAGKRVARVFDLHDAEYFERTDLGVYVVPHPSGINRWWNDPCNREMTREFLERF